MLKTGSTRIGPGPEADRARAAARRGLLKGAVSDPCAAPERSPQGTYEMVGVQFLSGRAEHGLAPALAGAGAEERLHEVASRDLVLVERAAGHVGLQVVPELGGDQVPQHVVLVVDRRYGYVDLGRPVRLVAPGRTVNPLESLDQAPPERVEVF